MNMAINILFIAAIGFGLLYSLISLVSLFVHTRRAAGKPSPAHLPPVSVCKPLKGLDDQIEQNLESFFQLDYPVYQLVFGVGEASDPVIAVVDRLMKAYPKVDAILVISERRIGLNPKINNLANIYPKTRHDLIVISDSNVRVRPHYLRGLVAEMDSPEVGLVTSTIRGTGTSSFGSLFENLHLNSFIAGSVFAVKRLFGISICIGKSMLMRRETLAAIGGFDAFSDFLAEDHSIGKSIQKRGLAIRTSGDAIDSINESWTFSRFVSRHIRWGTMRRHFSLLDYSAEILSHPILFATAYLLIRMDIFAAAVLISTLMLQTMLGMLSARVMKSDFPLFSAFLIPVKELIAFGIWLVPFFENTVEWRGHRFVVLKNTELRSVDDITRRTITRIPRRTYEATRRLTGKWSDRISARLAR